MSGAVRAGGFALVFLLAACMVLVAAVFAVTSTLNVAVRRVSGDDRLSALARYAAESGGTRAVAKLAEVNALLAGFAVPSSESSASVDAAVRAFCDGAAFSSASPASCSSDASVVSAAKVALFARYVPGAYPAGVTASAYWTAAFDASTPVSGTVSASGGLTSRYSVRFGLAAVGARRNALDDYDVLFRVAPVASTGEVVDASGRVVATARVELTPPSRTLRVSLRRLPFSQFMLFRNKTYLQGSTSSDVLYFLSNDVYAGPVHTNGAPAFVSGVQMKGRFTTAATSYTSMNQSNGATVSRSWPCSGDPYLNCATAFQGGAAGGVSAVTLPTNTWSQVRAAYGGDASNTSALGSSELQAAWNAPIVSPGVYYAAGSGAVANAGSNWLGGIYVNGDVTQLKLCVCSGRQRIIVTQGSAVTIFADNGDGSWFVTANGVTRYLYGSFNGMIYVNGKVSDLRGDGTTAPDVARNSRLTLTATGDVIVKDGFTYEVDPRVDASAVNVFGVYSSGGNILMDGPSGKSMDVHATFMASGGGKGFGTVNPFSQTRGCPIPSLNLVGSIVEDQSPGTGWNGTDCTANPSDPNSAYPKGYRRNYAYDPRLATGYASPFFPTQQAWNVQVDAVNTTGAYWTFAKGAS